MRSFLLNILCFNDVSIKQIIWKKEKVEPISIFKESKPQSFKNKVSEGRSNFNSYSYHTNFISNVFVFLS